MALRKSFLKAVHKLAKSTRQTGFLMLPLVFLSTDANAALDFKCPYDLYDLSALHSQNLDRVVLGVKIRDWTLEYWNEYFTRAEECIRQSNAVSSIKEAQYRGLQDRRQDAQSYFSSIQFNIDLERKEYERNKIINNSGLEGLRRNENGVPVITLPARKKGKSVTLSCDDKALNNGHMAHALSQSGFQQAKTFLKLCTQTNVMREDTADKVTQKINTMSAFFEKLDGFVNHVELASKQNISKEVVQNLIDELQDAMQLNQSLWTPVSGDDFDDGSGRYVRAAKQLIEWDTMACDQALANAKFPAAWKNYMIESPTTPISTVLCRALDNGARVRYLTSGIWNKLEGFEVRSPNRTVQVFLAQLQMPGADPKAPKIMVPVRAQVYGKMHDIDNPGKNMELWVELGAAVKNQ